MINEAELIIALEPRKRLVKQDAVCRDGKFCYAVLWTEILAEIRRLTGGDAHDPNTETQIP